jgi:aldoxime dehydratase
MESAIPAHLKKNHTQEQRKPRGFQPPNPAWVARFDPLVDEVVMAYFGVQSKDKESSEGLAPLLGFFAQSNGPKHWERARYTDAQGYDTIIAIAYWDRPALYRQWRADSGFDAWWTDAERTRGPYGYFLEVVTPSADRFETLRSSPGHQEGIARLEKQASGEIEEHAYWGSMRDRIPASQVDDFASDGRPVKSEENTLGRRVVLQGRDNLALIRSGQDWSDTAAQERALYLNDIQPTLAAGMHFLRDEGNGIGCLSCRYMMEIDADGKATEKTFGLAHFDNLANLESWARTHPTHLAIFGRFQKYVQDLNFNIALRLYHEVTVVPASGQYFEYINCHAGTGLLAAG